MTTWKHRFENPTVLAASVAALTTLCITLVTAVSGVLTAKIHADVERETAIAGEKRAYFVSAMAVEPDPKRRLQYFIDSGALPDGDCKLRIAVLNYSADCNPPK
jgi:hypothetical protein